MGSFHNFRSFFRKKCRFSEKLSIFQKNRLFFHNSKYFSKDCPRAQAYHLPLLVVVVVVYYFSTHYRFHYHFHIQVIIIINRVSLKPPGFFVYVGFSKTARLFISISSSVYKIICMRFAMTAKMIYLFLDLQRLQRHFYNFSIY